MNKVQFRAFKKQRAAEAPSGVGCTVGFFGAFSLIGAVLVVVGLFSLGGTDFSDGLMMVVFGSFLIAIGLLIMFTQLRRTRRVRGKTIDATGYEDHPAWIKTKVRADGHHGNEIALRPEFTTRAKVGCLGFATLLIHVVLAGIISDAGGIRDAIVPVLIFGVIGLVVLAFFIHAVARMMMVPDPKVLLSLEPLRPGQPCRLRVFQEGAFDIEEATATLTLEETASYSVGTNRRTDRNEILNDVIASAYRLRANATTPLLEGTIAIPPDAMHSYQGASNTIHWRLRIHMVIPGRPDVDMKYLLRVAPVAPPIASEEARP